MSESTTPRRRGRPRGERPALTSAQKMQRARERVLEALNAPDGEVARLPDNLLLEALAVAYRKGHSVALWQCMVELADRLNARTENPTWHLHLDHAFGQHLDDARARGFQPSTRASPST